MTGLSPSSAAWVSAECRSWCSVHPVGGAAVGQPGQAWPVAGSKSTVATAAGCRETGRRRPVGTGRCGRLAGVLVGGEKGGNARVGAGVLELEAEAAQSGVAVHRVGGEVFVADLSGEQAHQRGGDAAVACGQVERGGSDLVDLVEGQRLVINEEQQPVSYTHLRAHET